MWGLGSIFSARKPERPLEPKVEERNLVEALEATSLILSDDVDGAERELDKGSSTFHKLGKGLVASAQATLGFEESVMKEAFNRLSVAESSATSDRICAEEHAAWTKQASEPPDVFHSRIYAVGSEYALGEAVAQLMSVVVVVLSKDWKAILFAIRKMRRAYYTLDGIKKMEIQFKEGKESNTFDPEDFENELDAFVHSSLHFCYGIVLLLLSLVPPIVRKCFDFFGYNGDKKRGLTMLWEATKFRNLIGAMAALALLAYYNGFVRFCDIVPDKTRGEMDIEGYPREELADLLRDMRQRFPNSRIWQEEESRMMGANKNLEGAFAILSEGKKSTLKQVEALCVWEKSLNALFLHRYEICAEYFVECVKHNTWSHSLYYYIAASCHILLYRQSLHDPKVAEKHKGKAHENINKARENLKEGTWLTSKLSFDGFVERRIKGWEARAKEQNIDLVDTVCVDPIEEMIFFWNGHSRMNEEQLQTSLQRLAWCERESNQIWLNEGPEEKAINAVIRATILRALGKFDQAKQLILGKVLTPDLPLVKSQSTEHWFLPVAHFEMAAIFWMERPSYQASHNNSDEKPIESQSLEVEKSRMEECKKHLQLVGGWKFNYDMEARIGMKVVMAMAAVKKWEEDYGPKAKSG